MGLYHSMCSSKTATLRAIFIAPTKLKNHLPVSTGVTIPGGQGTYRMGTSLMRN